jgi:hypothetical protein
MQRCYDEAITVAETTLTEIRGIYAECWRETLHGGDGTVGVTTGCKLEGRVSILGRRNRFFRIPQLPDRLCGTPSHRVRFPWG